MALPPRVEEVSTGVFAYIQPDGSWWINNTGFVVGRDRVFGIDASSTERRTRGILDAIGTVTSAPVRTLLNTHHHGDHTHGNGYFTEATIIAHEAARELIIGQEPPPNGMVFEPVEWGALPPAPPFLTYSDGVDVWVDDRKVEVRYISTPAHTTNDSIAWLPEERVLYSGDLVFNGGTPFLLMGSVAGSLEALDRMRALDPAVIVPGHGPVCGPEIFDRTEGYLRFLQKTAADAHAAELSPLDAARQTDLGEYAEWLDAERIVGNLHRAYAELDGRERGATLDSFGILGEMVTFHGGPLRCYA
ncbi:cyclase [Geodermatophilus ruber]|uniref:Cyclase n=2 Tax=Geodermatophilus ruber TaxID=504800 RepID=A0A1I4BXQ9_9ACTN|nr:cyclase [Geodermatophilus ruber]